MLSRLKNSQKMSVDWRFCFLVAGKLDVNSKESRVKDYQLKNLFNPFIGQVKIPFGIFLGKNYKVVIVAGEEYGICHVGDRPPTVVVVHQTRQKMFTCRWGVIIVGEEKARSSSLTAAAVDVGLHARTCTTHGLAFSCPMKKRSVEI